MRWQGVAQAYPAPCLGLMLRALARKEEQCRQRDAALLNRVRSGVTHEVTAGLGRKVCIYGVFP